MSAHIMNTPTGLQLQKQKQKNVPQARTLEHFSGTNVSEQLS